MRFGAPSYYGTFYRVDGDLAPNSEPDGGANTDVDADIKCQTRIALANHRT